MVSGRQIDIHCINLFFIFSDDLIVTGGYICNDDVIAKMSFDFVFTTCGDQFRYRIYIS